MKKFIKIIICFCLVYTPFFANAYDPSSWSIDEIEYNKKSNAVEIQARKISNTAVKNAKYFTEIPVSAATLGSSAAMLIRGGLASIAIYGIVEGVGWIIDNGSVFKDKNKSNPEGVITTGYSIKYNCIATELTSCIKEYLNFRNLSDKFYKVTVRTLSTAVNTFQVDIYRDGPDSSTVVQEIFQVKLKNEVDRVPVSDSELGQAIIDSPAAPQVIPDIYNPNQPTKTPARDASQDKLKKAIPDSDPKGDVTKKPNKDTDGDGKPDVYDPELPEQGFDFELPAFCDWASVVCVWYEKYIDDSEKVDLHREDEKSFWEIIKDWFDWTKEEPDLPDSDNKELEIEEKQPDKTASDFDQTYISFGSTCPTFESRTISVGPISVPFNADMTPLCDLAAAVRPAILGLSYFWAAAIIIAAIREA